MNTPPATLPPTAATAVVTGSSSGIGRAIALALAAAGANVLIHARGNRAGAEAVAGAVTGLGRQAHVFCGDLAEPAQREALVAAAWQWRPNIDIWVNNAGADVLTGAAANASFEQKLETLWRVDVQATLALSRAAGQRMRQAGHGTIINIGWDQAAHGMAGDSGELFATTKGAIMAFSKSLAASLAPQVRVNCVAPGWIKTKWGDGASDAWQRRAVDESLLARWGTPEDVADVVRFLALDAHFVSGQILPVNGGFRHSSPS